MPNWRYIAADATTGAFTHWDVPLQREELRWDLSGPGALRGTISPEMPELRDVLREWDTLLYAEADDEIRWGGILQRSTYEGGKWSLEAAGFTSYAHGLHYLGSRYAKVAYDPTRIVEDIWAYIQAQPDGDLGLSVVRPTNCPVRVGLPAVAAHTEYKVDGQWVTKAEVPASKIEPDIVGKLASSMSNSATSLTLTSIGKFAGLRLPFDFTIGSETLTARGRSGSQLINLIRGVGSSSATGHSSGTPVKRAGTPHRKVDKSDPEPYLLTWWEAQDLGQEIDQLAQETPFDYTESHAWSGESIAHTLTIGYPRIGAKKPDLAFRQGENIIQVVQVQKDGDDYANTVIGLGKGEGEKTIRAEIANRDGRLRRTAVYTDKTASTTSRMRSLARRELVARSLAPEISSITVMDHANARIGDWAVGDDILVQAEIPWVGDVSDWFRITSWALESEHRATLSLARSDSFRYGS